MEPKKVFRYQIASDWNVGIFILKGEALFGSTKKKAYESELIIFKNGKEDFIFIETSKSMCRFLLLAGKPVDEAFYRIRNWVGLTEEEFNKCNEDFKCGKNGFEKCCGWKSSIANIN